MEGFNEIEGDKVGVKVGVKVGFKDTVGDTEIEGAIVGAAEELGIKHWKNNIIMDPRQTRLRCFSDPLMHSPMYFSPSENKQLTVATIKVGRASNQTKETTKFGSTANIHRFVSPSLVSTVHAVKGEQATSKIVSLMTGCASTDHLFDNMLKEREASLPFNML